MSANVILVFRFEDKVKRSLIEEMIDLAEAAGYHVVDIITQTRAEDPRYNIGIGKVEELKRVVLENNIKKVIFYNMLRPSQAYNLRKELKVEVMDRYELILEIFASRAGSREAKMQIELAKLKRELSFAREYINLQKRGELHGFLGGGKYAVDAYYTYITRRISQIEHTLEKARLQKSMRWSRRSGGGLYLVSLSGYTRAGKSTLFEQLTRKEAYIDGKPFATLSTLSRRTKISGYPVVVTDTIGFIDSLPDQLFDAFYTTLGETLFADVIILVVDISEEIDEVMRKFNTSIEILSNLGVSFNKIVVAANKIDLTDPSDVHKKVNFLAASKLPVIPISASKGIGIDALSKVIVSKLPDKKSETLIVEPNHKDVLEEALIKCKVHELTPDGEGRIRIIIEGRSEIIERLKARCS
ncbi:MAG: GTPase HflX [Infirmifilum sp.]|jgi:GTP-binding protein HflX|uniref:GTPase HflX n=1 Tax=Infirmifilum TaxID=2856573 RepID=UPI00235387DD